MTSVSDSGNKKLGASNQKPLLWSHKMQRKRQTLSLDFTSIMSESASSADPTSSPLSSSREASSSSSSSYSESFISSMPSSSDSYTSSDYSSSSQSSSSPESSSLTSSSSSRFMSTSTSRSTSRTMSSSRSSYSWSSPSNSWSSTVTPWISTTTEITTRTITEEGSDTSLPHITVYQPIPTSTLTATLFSTTSEQTGALSTDGTGQGGNSFSRNTGAIVGVALAVAFVVISSAFLIFFGCRRYRSRRQLVENMWKPPLPDDASDRHAASAVMRELGFVSVGSASGHSHDPAGVSADGLTPSATGHGHLSRHSSDGFQLSSQGHSSGESSTRGLLASARLAHGDDGSTSYFPQMVDPRRPHNLIIPASVPPLPPLPLTRSPASPNSPYSNPASLLNSASVVSPAPAAAVPNTPSPPPQWPRPTMPLPAFGSTSELPRLLQNDSYVSFRDDADYSRSIVRPGIIMRRDSDMTPADDDTSFTFHHNHPGRAL